MAAQVGLQAKDERTATEQRTTAHLVRSPGAYVPVLDGWRAVAILLVLLFHSFYNSDTSSHAYLQPVANFSGRLGALGVLIFFCISGYLITQKLLAESSATGRFSLRNFYVKRIFRIVPPLAAYLVVILTLSVMSVLPLSPGDWAAPLFLSNYIPGSWYTSHFWSLSVEEHFYLLWPICVLVSGWRRSMWIGILIIGAIAIWRPWELHNAAQQARILQHTDMRIDYIMMGCVVAIAGNASCTVKRLLATMGTLPAMLVLLCALISSTLPLPFDVRSIQALMLTLMVCGSASATAPFIAQMIANPPMLFIGRISYSLYIWQELFLGPSQNRYIHSPNAIPLKLLAAFVAACLSHYFVERPFIAYGRRFLVSQKTPDVKNVHPVEMAGVAAR